MLIPIRPMPMKMADLNDVPGLTLKQRANRKIKMGNTIDEPRELMMSFSILFFLSVVISIRCGQSFSASATLSTTASAPMPVSSPTALTFGTPKSSLSAQV